jgi:hypothetical protein
VDYGIGPHGFQASENRGAIANIQFVMAEVWAIPLKMLLPPPGIAAGPKEISPHIIVDAVNSPPARAEELNHLRPNQSIGTSDQHCSHCSLHHS